MHVHSRLGRIRCTRRWVIGAIFVICGLLVAACSTVVVERDPAVEPPSTATVSTTQELSNKSRSRRGNPAVYEVFGKRYQTLQTSAGFSERGVASWYGKKFHGRATSSGEIYDMYEMTAAHKHLPLPTTVRVTNLENGRSVVVKVNDRGPFHDNRIIDLSYAAALKLDVARKGTAFVEVSAIELQAPQTAQVKAPAPGGPGATGNTPPVDSTFSVYLQVGAFSEQQNAKRLSDRLSKYLTKAVRIRAAEPGEQPIYRVQVGPIANVDLADRLVGELVGLGVDDHHFVSN